MADGASPLAIATRFKNVEFSPEDREMVTVEIIARLRQGEAINAICQESHMPCDWTVRQWSDQDPQLATELARARERGYDQIAQDTLLIADGLKPVVTDKGLTLQSDTQRDKLRVETRLRVLAKWDPKRYGEAVQMRMADANGEKLDTTPMIRELLALVRPSDGSQAIDVTPERKKPAGD